ncbi:class I SAM-dependent methyltransferase [Deminuibacter soli]|uniref:Class I SAM-dependent methyltransferase n=1 Tax=Deminuibacter soli TaxID=2291815 RepID=A0A3E1NF87_9BACT|nr:class I SAM-dependent methyltransferase [Deminuibacter soli]RFM26643.1 class I SAM-dependent methyltransferase [Deminuibacter soli]
MSYLAFEPFVMCVVCKSSLTSAASFFQCVNPACGCRYPVVNGVPVLINPASETFQQTDFLSGEAPDIFFKAYKSPLRKFLKKVQPDITLNRASKKNYSLLAASLKHKTEVRILIVGGSIDGNGIQFLKNELGKDTVLVESDVAHGPNTNVILDAHNIPFKENTFDLVIAQAVLEHVLDPFLCVKEIYRVLKPGGQVYAETPFMQQVHGGQYDFHRFTFLGHRRLFRHFKQSGAGLVAGAGSAAAWSLRYFITSFAPTKTVDKAMSYGVNFLVFWLKYFDYILGQSKGSYDAACAYYFLGTKEEGYTLSDKELLLLYKGFRY